MNLDNDRTNGACTEQVTKPFIFVNLTKIIQTLPSLCQKCGKWVHKNEGE